jgi:hypothetical protein
MALLARAAILALLVGGCYSPDLRDCTVSCSGSDSCGSGEICGSDGYCASPEVAGTCANEMGSGSNPDTVDAATMTAMVNIHIMVTGDGAVSLNNSLQMTCDHGGSANGDCMYAVASHSTAALLAVITSGSHPFMSWMGMECMGSTSQQCQFTADTDVTVMAMFK